MQLPRINRVEIYRHTLQFKQPAGTSRGVYLTRKLWYVVLGNERFTAYGECAPLPDLSCDALEDSVYEQKLKEVCLSLYTLSHQRAISEQSLLDFSADTANTSTADSDANADTEAKVEDNVAMVNEASTGSNLNANASTSVNAGNQAKDDTLTIAPLTKATRSAQLRAILPEEIEQQVRDYPSIRFALEGALLQLNAESLVFTDTPFTRGGGIPINGLVWMGDIQEMAERIKQKLEQGFKCIKLKIGALDFDKELSLIEQLRERFGPEQIEIRVDANGAFQVAEALDKLERLAQFQLHSIEQPIKAGQWSDLKRLCQITPLPIALDEELIGINDRERKIELLDTLRPQYIILKPSLHGGLSGTLEWIELAHERKIPSWITSALESNIGLSTIAQFAGLLRPAMPQGLGTGKLFTNNIDMPLEIRYDDLFLDSKSLEETILPMSDYLSSNQAHQVLSLVSD